jgi:hypothetical protein
MTTITLLHVSGTGVPSSGSLPAQRNTSPTTNGYKFNMRVGLVSVRFRRLPEDGTSVPKHVGV